MKNEPCARLTTFIRPKISERPADIRNSRLPNTRPLTSWVAMNSMAAIRWSRTGDLVQKHPSRSPVSWRNSTRLGRRLDHVGNGVDDLVREAAIELDDFSDVHVLDRALRDRIEAE